MQSFPKGWDLPKALKAAKVRILSGTGVGIGKKGAFKIVENTSNGVKCTIYLTGLTIHKVRGKWLGEPGWRRELAGINTARRWWGGAGGAPKPGARFRHDFGPTACFNFGFGMGM